MLSTILRPIDSFMHAMFGDLAPTGRAWARVGIIVLGVAALMSYDFGASVSWKHGAFLALLSFVAAFGPEAAHKAWEEGRKGVATTIAVLCVPLLAIEFYSHAGYTAGLRGDNIATAKVANVKYDNATDAVKEDKANLTMWTERLAKLEAENAWVVTVTADALRAQAVNMEGDKVFKRSKECANVTIAESRKFCDKLADIRSRISLAEEKATLTKQIEGTKKVLADARSKADTTEYKSSAVVHQNEFLAKAVALVGYGELAPSATIEETAQQSANLMMALAGTGLPAFALFIAGLYRRKEQSEDAYQRPAPRAMTETRRQVEDRYQEIKAGENPKDKSSVNLFMKSGASKKEILDFLEHTLRNADMRTA
jgi:hypothetical protein